MESDASDGDRLVAACCRLVAAYRAGLLGDERIPEDIAPEHWRSQEEQLAYLTLPMSVNYRRQSDALWRAAREGWGSPATRWVFDPHAVTDRDEEALRAALTATGIARQPVRHTLTWRTICATVAGTWGSFGGLLNAAGHDVLELGDLVRRVHKRGFPYLSGPKLFNYWCFILARNAGVRFVNADAIDIAVDSRVFAASVRLGGGGPRRDAGHRGGGAPVAGGARRQRRASARPEPAALGLVALGVPLRSVGLGRAAVAAPRWRARVLRATAGGAPPARARTTRVRWRRLPRRGRAGGGRR